MGYQVHGYASVKIPWSTDGLIGFKNGIRPITRDWGGKMWGLYPLWRPLGSVIAISLWARYPVWLSSFLYGETTCWWGVN